MASDDDSPPDLIYKYSWFKGESEAAMSLEEFLRKFKPSMVQDDGTKPWIWIGNEKAPRSMNSGVEAAFAEGKELLDDVTKRVEAIKNDSSIPLRSNKKTGAKSKKELREEIQAEAADKLKAISIKHGFVSGKWLIFAAPDKVDMIWSSIAASIVSGPLASTSVGLAKVATSPWEETPGHQHVICIYMPDAYDKDAVAEVMRVLLRHHGASLSGVKSNLYTYLGIDSKHPSGIPSTIWKNTAVLKDDEIKELRDAFFAGLGATTKQTSSGATGDQNTGDASATKSKPKRKKFTDNAFASDGEKAYTQGEEDASGEGTSSNVKKPSGAATSAKGKAKPKKKAEDMFASETEDEDDKQQEAQRKQDLKAKKGSSAAAAKRPKDDDDDDEEEGPDEPPKKRRSRK